MAFNEIDTLLAAQARAFQSHPIIREGIMRVRIHITERITQEQKWLKPPTP